MTIKEIAELANVSASTVSLIMNNKCDNISQSTKEKVLKIAEENNYAPYSKAVNKALTKNKLIGIIVPDIARTTYSLVIRHLDQAFTENGYAMVVKGAESDGYINLDILISKHVEYIIGFDIILDNFAKDKLAEQKILFLPNYINIFPHTDACSTINTAKAIEDGLKYFDRRGLSQVAFFGNQQDIDLIRLCQEVMKKNNRIVDTTLFFEVDNHFEADMAAFFKMGIKAAFIANTHLAQRIYQYAFSKLISIPEDLSLLTLDYQGNANEFIPPLSSYQLPYENITKVIKKEILRLSKHPSERLRNEKIDLTFFDGESVIADPSNQKVTITTVGGINMDLTFQIDEIPKSSGSMLIKDRMKLPGGKAANQAISVAKLGGHANVIAILGNDKNGKELYNNLIKNKIDVSGVTFENEVTTSEIYIFVSSNAEYFYGEYPEISYSMTKAHVNNHIDKIRSSQYCLIQQTGIPQEVVEYVGEICRKYKVKMILKPYDINAFSDSFLTGLYMIVPNKTEICNAVPGNASAMEKADSLIKKGIQNIVVTLGADGCYYTDGIVKKTYPGIEVNSVDMSGASDAFIGTLSVFLAEGDSIESAIVKANIIAGLSTTRIGSQPSIPDRSTLSLYQARYNL